MIHSDKTVSYADLLGFSDLVVRNGSGATAGVG
jgi:hypothetical protein